MLFSPRGAVWMWSFGSSGDSGKRLYSDRTVDLAILEIMPIQAFPESLT